jgi:hypothetical protein
LDWREICDGKQNCLDGADEKDCWQLELNQCDDNEYRCVNGQCIPNEYVHDDIYNTDCLDRTDKVPFPNRGCFENPDFICEEHTCRPGEEEFSCGDGQCINELSKCGNGRHKIFLDNLCSNITVCSMKMYNEIDHNWCLLFCSKDGCVKNNCSTIYDFRILSLLFGHVRVTISKGKVNSDDISAPNYVCYDGRLCPHFPPPTALFQNSTCHHFSDLKLRRTYSNSQLDVIGKDIRNLFRGCLITVNEPYYCNYSTMYQCENSTKCITKSRLLDGIQDCPFNDDETYNQSCSLNDSHQRFKCRNERNERCFTLLAMRNGKKECTYGEDEYDYLDTFIRTHISFPTICDGIAHLLPLSIDGQNETDETRCESWECNNTYTRCDDIWHCKNGADEINCPTSTCPDHYHGCVFPNNTSTLSCLPIAQAGNDIDDCLGGTDERKKYRTLVTTTENGDFINYQFHCRNSTKIISINNLCNNIPDCQYSDDETMCRILEGPRFPMCWIGEKPPTDVENFFCKLHHQKRPGSVVFFKLHNVRSYLPRITTDNNSIALPIRTKSVFMETDLNKNLPSDSDWRCNRGVSIHLRMTENTSILSCLCPPSYYGDRCQYQNQRVSLTIRVQVASEWRSIFVFLITLIDNEKTIESHDYFEFLPIRDCKATFNTYLLYASRPKNSSKVYSVQIDVFNGPTLKYRASWVFPLRFSFLPVHRLSVLLRVPFLNTIFTQRKCSLPCMHGQCFQYVNDQSSTFCHCEVGWSGIHCNIKHKCDCALGAVCISDSICLCPPGQFGTRCHLFQSLCDSMPCLNGGQCAPPDVRYTHSDAIRSNCMCPEGYVGDYCQEKQKQTRIDISFHHKLTLPWFLLVHFITVRTYIAGDRNHLGTEPNRTSVAKKLQFDQNSLTLYTTVSFNIAIAQMSDQYYLIILRKQVITSANISTEVAPSYRCLSLGELFNETFTKDHLLKRIKYYHIPCQQNQELVCFYDDVHICLCTLDRSANCFEFNHKMTYHCQKYNYCENEGHCFQDNIECPTSSFCTCRLCYFGSRCQFSTKESVLSLDIILGYHFRSKTSLSQQPTIVKIATVLTTIILVVGIINGFFSFQTFRGKEARIVGCGLYLFTSSIISMCTIVVLSLKFTFFIASQTNSINSRLFLQIQCILMDFLLRSLLSIIDWLNACVAIERMISVTQGVSFNKTNSKQIAKRVISVVFVLISCSYIYDPIYRRLKDDKDEQRTWCLSQYPTAIQISDRLLNIFHFSVPFAINCISAMTVIIITARTRSDAQKGKVFREYLREQFHQHKHLLISPFILIVLTLPRLVLSFLAGCMGSSRESWFYMIGYFIAFIPSIMTFPIFILPSKVYMKEFTQFTRRFLHLQTNSNK